MLGPWTQSSPVCSGPRDVTSVWVCVAPSADSSIRISFAEVLAFGSPTEKESEYFRGSQPRREQVTLLREER